MIKYKSKFVRYTPPSLRNALLSRFHLLGHYAHKKLVKLITQTDFWPGLTKECKEFTNKCISCIWIRPGNGEKYKLGYPITGRTGDVWFLDVVSGLPNSFGYSFFVSVIDTFSRFCVTFPLRTDTSREIVKLLETRVFSVFGSPEVIVTDGAQNLTKSHLFQELCYLYRTKAKIRSAYSSRSLGLCERVHRSILDCLRSLSDSFQNSWSANLALATAIYNTVPHTATGLSPHELMFGKTNKLWNPLPEISQLRVWNPSVSIYHKELREKLEKLYEFAKRNDKDYKEKMRKSYGGISKEYKPGTFDLSKNKLPAVNQKIKVRPKYYGPFLVLENLETVVVGENVLNGRISYLNKNLIKQIEEKSITKYANLPFHCKQVFGQGFKYEDWEKMYKEDKLVDHLTRRNKNEVEFGVEHALEKLVPFREVVEAKDEIIQKPQNDTSTSDSSETDNNVNSKEKQSSTKKKHRVKFNIPEDETSTLRPRRLIKAPSRLNL